MIQTLQNKSRQNICINITGIEPHGNKVLQPAVFTVETLEAGSGEVLVYVEDPEGHKEEASCSWSSNIRPALSDNAEPQVQKCMLMYHVIFILPALTLSTYSPG